MSSRQMNQYLSKRKKKRRLKPSRVISLVIMLIVICLFLVGCGNLAWAVITLPSYDPSKLAGNQSTIVYDRYDQQASQVFVNENRTSVPLAELPSNLPNAFVASEDNRFYEHSGLDPVGIARSLWVDLRGGAAIEGGSTIDPKALLKAPCLIGKGCRIAAGAQIGPYTVVGDRAVIGAQAKLDHCILFDNVTVGKDVHLSNCILGANGQVRENITVYEAAVLNIRE